MPWSLTSGSSTSNRANEAAGQEAEDESESGQDRKEAIVVREFRQKEPGRKHNTSGSRYLRSSLFETKLQLHLGTRQI